MWIPLRVVNALLSPIIFSQVRLFSDLKLIENWFFSITHSRLKLECSTKWWTSATPYSDLGQLEVHTWSFYKSKTKIVKSAIWPNWYCQQSITVLSTPPSSMPRYKNLALLSTYGTTAAVAQWYMRVKRVQISKKTLFSAVSTWIWHFGSVDTIYCWFG